MRLLTVITAIAFLASAQAISQQPPLCDAALRGDVAATRRLLDGGADPNVRDRFGSTPLLYAASTGARSSKGDFLDTAKLLLQRGADPHLKNSTGRTAWLEATVGHASEHGIIPVSQPLVELLLASKVDVNSQGADGTTALHQVAGQWASQPEIVRLLLDRGARPNLADKEGKTALMVAAARGKTEIVTLLRARGADARLKDGHGRTALDLAVDAGYPETVGLLAVGEPATAARAASKRAFDQALLRHIEAAEFMEAGNTLAQGADANAGRETGAPALVLAAGHSEGYALVGQLLEKGAAVNSPARDGTTALMASAALFNLPLCQLLFAHGAALEARDAHSNTALLRAANGATADMEERFHLVQWFLVQGADSKAANDGGVTALMLAARRAASPVMDVLLTYGADVNARDLAGRTALAIAVLQADVGAVELLLNRGADVNACDRAGRSVLLVSVDAADRFSYQDQEKYSFGIFRLLVQRGARVDLADSQGNTPLLVARRRGYAEAVALLEGK